MSTQKLIEDLQGWQEHYSDPADKNNYVFFTALIAAVDRLEAAERERDELKQRLANSEHQLHMAELAKFNLRNQRRAQFSKRREAEAEIARRDAAAGEPDYWQFKSVNGDWIGIGESGMRQAVSEGVEVRPLYTAASPAVLPPEKITEIMQDAWNEFCDDTGCYPDDFKYQNEQLFFDADRWAMLVAEKISSLGAQPQKVVELPGDSVTDGLAAAVNLLLDSDGSRGTFSAIRRGNALAEVERFLAAAPAPGGDDVKQG